MEGTVANFRDVAYPEQSATLKNYTRRSLEFVDSGERRWAGLRVGPDRFLPCLTLTVSMACDLSLATVADFYKRYAGLRETFARELESLVRHQRKGLGKLQEQGFTNGDKESPLSLLFESCLK